MPATPCRIIVTPDVAVSVTIYTTTSGSVVAPAYTTENGSTLYTFPVSIAAGVQTTFWLPNPGNYSISALEGGSEIAGNAGDRLAVGLGPGGAANVRVGINRPAEESVTAVGGPFQPLGTSLPILATVLAPNPSGGDDTAAVQVQLTAAAGGEFLFRNGTYIIDPTGTGLQVSDNTVVTIPAGCTVKMKDNTATANAVYNLFTAANAATPNNIRFRGTGTIDGNKRGGNHGAGEWVFGLNFTDVYDFYVDPGLTFYNFRSEGVTFGRGAGARVPRRVRILGATFNDCGVHVGGDSNVVDRMGVSGTAGADVLIAGNVFDTIGATPVDLEGNNVNDTFDRIVVTANSYANYGSAYPVALTSPGAITNWFIEPQLAWKAVLGGVGFKNSWVNYGAGRPAAAYRKLDANHVELVGCIKTGTSGNPAFTLPTGYRPTTARMVPITDYTSAVPLTLFVDSTGDVTPYGSTPANATDIACIFAIDA